MSIIKGEIFKGLEQARYTFFHRNLDCGGAGNKYVLGGGYLNHPKTLGPLACNLVGYLLNSA